MTESKSGCIGVAVGCLSIPVVLLLALVTIAFVTRESGSGRRRTSSRSFQPAPSTRTPMVDPEIAAALQSVAEKYTLEERTVIYQEFVDLLSKCEEMALEKYPEPTPEQIRANRDKAREYFVKQDEYMQELENEQVQALLDRYKIERRELFAIENEQTDLRLQRRDQRRREKIERLEKDERLYVLKTDSPGSVAVSRTKEVDNRFTELAVAGDVDGINTLIHAGLIILVPEGTVVRAINRGLLHSEVKIEEGRYEGEYGWVSTEWLSTDYANANLWVDSTDTGAETGRSAVSKQEPKRQQAELAERVQQREEAKRLAEEQSRQQAVQDAKSRTWTSADGNFNVEATFTKYANGVVTLLKADGEFIEVPLEKLAPDDQEFIKKRKWLKAGEDL